MTAIALGFHKRNRAFPIRVQKGQRDFVGFDATAAARLRRYHAIEDNAF